MSGLCLAYERRLVPEFLKERLQFRYGEMAKENLRRLYYSEPMYSCVMLAMFEKPPSVKL